MTKVITTNSFRGGTGKSTIISNIAYTLASLGMKVMIIDADIISPGVHAMFGLDKDNFSKTLTEHLLKGAKIEDVVYDISSSVGLPEKHLYLIPSSIHDTHIVELLKETENFEKVGKSIDKLKKEFNPDFILIDTHPGLNEQFLVATSFTDILLSVIRPDNQDYQGAQVTSEIAKKVKLKTYLVVNKVHQKENKEKLKKSIGDAFMLPIAGMLPLSDDIILSQSTYIISEKYPKNEFSKEIQTIIENTLGIKPKEHLEMMHDLLELIFKKDNLPIKELCSKEGINTPSCKRYVNDFLRDGFVVSKKDKLTITKKGKKFLDRYHTIRKFVDNFRL